MTMKMVGLKLTSSGTPLTHTASEPCSHSKKQGRQLLSRSLGHPHQKEGALIPSLFYFLPIYSRFVLFNTKDSLQKRELAWVLSVQVPAYVPLSGLSSVYILVLHCFNYYSQPVL
jgi:hypothetical protein